MERFTLHLGKSEEVLRDYPENHFDSVVCDPPYHLTSIVKRFGGKSAAPAQFGTDGAFTRTSRGFMGKEWDGGDIAFRPEFWAEVYRVLKPGGHLLAFSGSRTYHRMACGIEDAGFEIRDQVMWLYGSGFPKSHDVSKGIDRKRDDRADILRVTTFMADAADKLGISRADIDAEMGTSDMGGWWLSRLLHRCQCPKWDQWLRLKQLLNLSDEMDSEVWRLNGRKGQPGEAWNEREVTGQHEGHAFAEWETNCGNERDDEAKARRDKPATEAARKWQGWGSALKPAHEPICVARKPLIGTIAENVLEWGTGALNIDGCRIATDENLNGGMYSQGDHSWANESHEWGHKRQPGAFKQPSGRWPANVIHDGLETEWSRFFYCAKAGKKDRDEGLDGLPLALGGSLEGENDKRKGDKPQLTMRANTHPTVKPTDLMRYLCRLVTPPSGVVLDPFMGSGSTGKAAMLEGFRFVGIDMTEEYISIARARIEHSLKEKNINEKIELNKQKSEQLLLI